MAFKPSKEEQKWAKRRDMDINKELGEILSEKNKGKVRKLYAKRCPKDENQLVSVEIDGLNFIVEKCPKCGGIWINKRDLEKFLQSSRKPEYLLNLISKTLGIEISKYK